MKVSSSIPVFRFISMSSKRLSSLAGTTRLTPRDFKKRAALDSVTVICVLACSSISGNASRQRDNTPKSWIITPSSPAS